MHLLCEVYCQWFICISLHYQMPEIELPSQHIARPVEDLSMGFCEGFIKAFENVSASSFLSNMKVDTCKYACFTKSKGPSNILILQLLFNHASCMVWHDYYYTQFISKYVATYFNCRLNHVICTE